MEDVLCHGSQKDPKGESGVSGDLDCFKNSWLYLFENAPCWMVLKENQKDTKHFMGAPYFAALPPASCLPIAPGLVHRQRRHSSDWHPAKERGEVPETQSATGTIEP